jgi:hypothetical protein
MRRRADKSTEPTQVNFRFGLLAGGSPRRRGPAYGQLVASENMRLVINIFRICLVSLLAVFGNGCVSEQRSEFRGTIIRGAIGTNAPTVQQTGGQFQCLNPSFADALTGFSVPQGGIVIVHDRQKYISNDYRLSTDAISAVYFREGSILMDENTFLNQSVAARDQAAGMHRLQGTFKVERWKSNIDFRIRFSMRSTEPDPITVEGVLADYDHWGFHPVQALGLILASMGLIAEGPSLKLPPQAAPVNQ